MLFQATIYYGDGLQSTRPPCRTEQEMRTEVADIVSGLTRFHYPIHRVILRENCAWCRGNRYYRVARGKPGAGTLRQCARCHGSGVERVLPTDEWRYIQ